MPIVFFDCPRFRVRDDGLAARLHSGGVELRRQGAGGRLPGPPDRGEREHRCARWQRLGAAYPRGSAALWRMAMRQRGRRRWPGVQFWIAAARRRRSPMRCRRGGHWRWAPGILARWSLTLTIRASSADASASAGGVARRAAAVDTRRCSWNGTEGRAADFRRCLYRDTLRPAPTRSDAAGSRTPPSSTAWRIAGMLPAPLVIFCDLRRLRRRGAGTAPWRSRSGMFRARLRLLDGSYGDLRYKTALMTAPDIHGVCPPRFAAVKDAFAANFTDAPEGLNEQAARFSVCHRRRGGGRPVGRAGPIRARTTPSTRRR